MSLNLLFCLSKVISKLQHSPPGGTKRDHVTTRDHVTKKSELITGDVDQKKKGEFVRGCGNAMFVVGMITWTFNAQHFMHNRLFSSRAFILRLSYNSHSLANLTTKPFFGILPDLPLAISVSLNVLRLSPILPLPQKSSVCNC